jgi:preprotein translocase subunit SecD
VQRPRKGVAIFKIRPEVESRFRESAVNQAKDTINRRVDELGLREAAVTVRDEDIIIEVPGEDERTFKEIRDIISQTARLEFKMLDDSTDFIGQATRGVKEEDLPKGVSVSNIENAPVGPGQTKPTHYAVVLKQPNETMKEARARLVEWISTLNVPDDHELARPTPTVCGRRRSAGVRTISSARPTSPVTCCATRRPCPISRAAVSADGTSR